MLSVNRGIEEIFEDDVDLKVSNSNVFHDNIIENNYNSNTSNDENIITTAILPTQAFEVFCGKFYGVKTNSNVVTYEYEKGIFELPWQKLARIKSELNELKQSLENNQQMDLDTDSNILSVITKETNSLLLQSEDIENSESFHLYKKNKKHIGVDDIKLLTNSIKSSQHPSTFSKNISNQSIASSQDISLIQLEKRLALIEIALGYSSNSLDLELSSQLNKGTSVSIVSHNLLELLNKLEQKINFMDVSAVDNLKGKITALRLEMEAALKSKLSSVDGKVIDACKKVDDLHLWVSKVENIADELPKIIIRLKNLEELHSTAYSVASSVNIMKENLLQLEKQTKENQQVLSNLTKSLEENLTLVKSNLTAIESKIKS